MTTSTMVSARPKRTLYEGVTLPLRDRSLCPACRELIDAVIDERDGGIYMDKTCPRHGHYSEFISSDAKFYKLMLSRDKSSVSPVSNPVSSCGNCPDGCGICEGHLSGPIMINIDLTNRCNLNCPVCFANAGVKGRVVEPSLRRIRKMLDNACSIDEAEPACLQYTGGEPTLYAYFLEALREGKKRGFAQIQVATNGIIFAQNSEFAYRASEAGLNIAYLQFDGLDDAVYFKTRGRSLIELKVKAIENLYKAGIRTVLVPTILKGVNDHQIGDITRFAIENVKRITGISWQPAAFTGRIDYKQRLQSRFTMTDLAFEMEQQSGLMDMYRDWYPLSAADPFVRLLESVRGKKANRMSCSWGCGLASYLIVNVRDGRSVPLSGFVDVEPLMDKLGDIAEKVNKKMFLSKLSMVSEFRRLEKYYHAELGPVGWTFETFVDFMMDFADFGRRYSDNEDRRKLLSEMDYRALLIMSMHFQDVYNYQLSRVQRCVVHYAGPDGRIYPFCSYNCGPCNRKRIEKRFGVSLERQSVSV